MDERMNQGFGEAIKHRQSLQEDLEASIAMLGRHQEKLERISI